MLIPKPEYSSYHSFHFFFSLCCFVVVIAFFPAAALNIIEDDGGVLASIVVLLLAAPAISRPLLCVFASCCSSPEKTSHQLYRRTGVKRLRVAYLRSWPNILLAKLADNKQQQREPLLGSKLVYDDNNEARKLSCSLIRKTEFCSIRGVCI
jgi:hypothetical protein